MGLALDALDWAKIEVVSVELEVCHCVSAEYS